MSKTPFEFTHEGITYIQNNRAKYCSACAAVEVCNATRHNERRNNLCGPDDLIYNIKENTTPKTKETKTMSTTKKPGTSHGKPTAKGMKEALKPKTTPKPKYPAARVQISALVPVKPLDKMTKTELIETYYALRDQFDNQAADHCIAGTKLDRALVDLKEARAKIKSLEATK